jgi:hypothetical protein
MTTTSDRDQPIAANLLDGCFEAEAPNQRRVGHARCERRRDAASHVAQASLINSKCREQFANNPLPNTG